MANMKREKHVRGKKSFAKPDYIDFRLIASVLVIHTLFNILLINSRNSLIAAYFGNLMTGKYATIFVIYILQDIYCKRTFNHPEFATEY